MEMTDHNKHVKLKVTEVTGSIPPALSLYIGCLTGGAVGDALGYPVEFLSEKSIFRQFGTNGIKTLKDAGHPAVISDDTQMILFASNGYIYRQSHPQIWETTSLMDSIWLAYEEWLGTQGDTSRMDKDAPKMWLYREPGLHVRRAPGNTCLNAIRSSRNGGTIKKPVNNSKGCGSVMRAAPYGLMACDGLKKLMLNDVVYLAGQDAALTHGHPLAWGSSGWMAGIIYNAVQNRCGRSLEACIQDVSVPECFDPEGRLKKLITQAILLAGEKTVSDLEGIHKLGEGWVAEEALAIAVFCAVRYENDFAAAIRAAVNHKGDSDSTGAVCGNILGAWLGIEAIEEAFDLGELELREVIRKVAEELWGFRC